MSTAARRIVANLDVEARAAGERLPPRVLQRLSAAATLMRAFAGADDRLHTPAPVDPRRMASVVGLPSPPLESGSAAVPASESGQVFWCRAVGEAFLSRAVDFEIMTALDLTHPGARLVLSTNDFVEAVAAPSNEAWVLKPMWSAAGRGQLRGRGERLDDGTLAVEAPAVRRLLTQGGGALMEPWVPRLADFGCVGEIRGDGNGARLGLHRVLVDARGAFGGIELRVDGSPPDDLRAAERATLEQTLQRVGAWLATRGFSGPYGIDAYRYLDDTGAVTFQPLCELNARMSFGHVARALVDRIAPHAGWGATDTVRLQFGRGAVPTSPRHVPLLTPDPAGDDDTCAWLSPRAP